MSNVEEVPIANGRCMSRIRARSEAYALSDDNSSSNACVRFEMGTTDGDSMGSGEGVLSRWSSRSSSSGTEEIGVTGKGFSGVCGRGYGRDSSRIPKLRERNKVMSTESAVLSREMDRGSKDTALNLGLKGERGGIGGEAGGGRDEGAGLVPVSCRPDGTNLATRRE